MVGEGNRAKPGNQLVKHKHERHGSLEGGWSHLEIKDLSIYILE